MKVSGPFYWVFSGFFALSPVLTPSCETRRTPCKTADKNQHNHQHVLRKRAFGDLHQVRKLCLEKSGSLPNAPQFEGAFLQRALSTANAAAKSASRASPSTDTVTPGR